MIARLQPRQRAEIEAALGHHFREPALLEEALTHASSVRPAPGRPPRRNYQRLEFLGDRVLGLIIAHAMIERFPDDGEGPLTHRHGALVREEALAEVAVAIGLGRWLQAASSEFGPAGRHKPAMLADCCEALIGALYLDGGLEAARRFVATHWQRLLASVQLPPRDAKMVLQEWAQARGIERPAYGVVATEGPPHAMTFKVEVRLAGQPPATATGTTKRAAERAAAALMLRRLEEAAHG